MKKLLIIFISLGLMISCSKSKTPDYVIPHNKMVDIIVDIHLLDGMLSMSDLRKDIMRLDTGNVYNTLLKNYGYSRHDFDTSLFYYSKQVRQM